jgi:hypothetical protein
MSDAGEWEMGEKGNLLDMGEEIFASLAEQGPRFWLDYEQYKLSRAQSVQAGTVAEHGVAAQGAPAERSASPTAG